MLKRIGNHRLFVGDITRGAIIGLCDHKMADLVYCVPPADLSEAKFSRLKYHAAATTWPSFVAALADAIADNCTGMAAVEMSDLLAATFPEIMQARRFRTLGITPNQSKSSRSLWCGSRNPNDIAIKGRPSGNPVSWFLSCAGVAGAIVLDPCIGFGATARAAISLGMTVWGADIDPKKILATKRILEGEEK